MFSMAYVILPFSDHEPAHAIRNSLAPFQRGGSGELPDDWLTFHDETAWLRHVHEATLAFLDQGQNGLRISGDTEAHWYIDDARVRKEMRRRALRTWQVRFADEMDLETFFDLFCHRLERHSSTGRYGRWLNSLGRWDWWDLGGRFDGYIIGEPNRGAGRGAAQISSGAHAGRVILANIEEQLVTALGQAPVARIDVRSDRNIELAATLLAETRAGQEHACPGALVLPPGSIEDRSRWLTTWPELGPREAFAWLGLPADPSWPQVAEASYALFQDRWVAGLAYHH